jgi:hypothetical protein
MNSNNSRPKTNGARNRGSAGTGGARFSVAEALVMARVGR